MTYVRQFRAHVGNRIGALALGAVLLLAALVFLAFGIVLIVGLTAAGLVLGLGAALYKRLTRTPPATPRQPGRFGDLDPALEVLPPPGAPPTDRLDSGIKP